MGKRRSPMLQKVSNLIKVSIFIAKMRLVYLKKSTKLTKFKALKNYNSYGFLQEHQFSPSTTPLICFHRHKTNCGLVYSIRFLSCFGGRRHHGVVVDDSCSFESAILEVDRDIGSGIPYEDDDDDGDSVDERAERFIERFYEEINKQRRESLSSSSSANNILPLNRMLEC